MNERKSLFFIASVIAVMGVIFLQESVAFPDSRRMLAADPSVQSRVVRGPRITADV